MTGHIDSDDAATIAARWMDPRHSADLATVVKVELDRDDIRRIAQMAADIVLRELDRRKAFEDQQAA